MQNQSNRERAGNMTAPLARLEQDVSTPITVLLPLYLEQRFGSPESDDDVIDMLGDMLTDTLHHARCAVQPQTSGYLEPSQLDLRYFALLLSAVDAYCRDTLSLTEVPDFTFRAYHNYMAEQMENPE